MISKVPTEIQELMEYVKNGTSSHHVIAHTKNVLDRAGFQELNIRDNWELEKGGRYYCIPFNTTLHAFTIGEECDLSEGIHIGAAHTDFPAIRIKPNPELKKHGYLQLNTEVYGGPILNTFFDRPLSLAGKVVTRGPRYDKPVSHLLDFKRPILYLPNLAIHMNRGVNENGAPIDNQKDLLPILGTISDALSEDTSLIQLLAWELEVKEEDILDYDLNLYNMDQPEVMGYTEEFLSSPRLDDLTSVSALIHGLIAATQPGRVNLASLYDNEETGSLSKQGADSDLPSIIIGKIWQAFGKSYVECMSDLTAGRMLSMDVAHAFHPNFPACQDITNYPILNKGMVLKTASNQSYSWDTEVLGSIIALCRDEDIPFQRFAKHSNNRGGGTIGSIISSHIPVPTADIGVGILAMHSAREFMGIQDQVALEQFTKAFFCL